MDSVLRDVLLVVFLAVLCCFPVFGSVSFTPDDYRYLNQVQSLLSGGLDVHSLSVITNPWSRLWWYRPGGDVVFFRPVVVFSFLFDYLLWGLDARGFALTSVLVHVLCSVVVYFLFVRLLGGRRLALLGGLLFAAHPVHGEAVWYIAGRTDSLAALFWLLAFFLYLRLDERSVFYFLSLAFFFLALAAKESSVSLLALLPVYDLFFPAAAGKPGWSGRLRLGRYAAFASVFVLYYLLRFFATGVFFAGNMTYPYFFTPFMPGFVPHLAVMVLVYLFNLVWGFHTVPFFSAGAGFAGDLLSVYLVPLFFVVLFFFALFFLLRVKRRIDRRLVFMSFFVFVTWLPASVVYMSERFLYLPSVGFVGILALVFSGVESLISLRGRLAVNVLLALLLVHYAVSLVDESAYFSKDTCPEFMLSRFRQVVGNVSPGEGGNVFVLNYVDEPVCSVFLEEIIRTAYPGGNFSVRILTASRDRGDFSVRRVDDSTIEVVTEPLFRENALGFESRPLSVGDVVEEDLFNVSVLNVSDEGVRVLRFVFREPLGSQTFLVLDRGITRFDRLSFGGVDEGSI